MRRFASEFVHSYGSYSFGYCLYAEREAHDSLAELYGSGFLPYSGNASVRNVLYMARSLRIRLEEWQPNSENRRVSGKFLEVTRTCRPVSEMGTASEEFLAFCLGYFAERHGDGVMPRERLAHILSSGFVTHIAEYRKDDRLLGYVFLGLDDQIAHFYYSFYDLEYLRQSLGLWLMIEEAKAAKEAGRTCLYLGTAYGEKGLYKSNFDQLEFWDGEGWRADRSQLRERCRADGSHAVDAEDAWKVSLTHE